MKLYRASGVLLHPTSLPGDYGIGDFGTYAYKFVDFLAETKQKLWQILPLGPTGYGNSPYQSYSAFAGNYFLVSPEILMKDGLLEPSDIAHLPEFPSGKVDYASAEKLKSAILKKSFESFKAKNDKYSAKAFKEFCKENSSWLEDFSLFMVLREHHDLKPWDEWETDLVKRNPKALKDCCEKFAQEIEFQNYLQFEFFKQWEALRKYANNRSIRIIGDIPIYAAHNSADVWSNPRFFKVDETGILTGLSGVPPDYYCATGQLWGNPTYRWDVLKKSDYSWWVERLRAILKMVDMARLDHFRGFEAYWEVPAGETTAVNGKWVKCPGDSLLGKFKKVFKDIPIIAENLGVITPEVEGLREKYNLPGMIVTQFAFESDYSQFASFEEFDPRKFPKNSVVYTGTHDNNTTAGWYNEKPGEATTLSPEDLKKKIDRIAKYFKKTDGSQIHWDMIEDAIRASSDFAIFPMQDILGLGKEARMNTPGTSSGNWEWRFKWALLTADIRKKLKDLTVKYKRG